VSEVKRYHADVASEHIGGAFVTMADYATLRAERDALAAKLARVLALVPKWERFSAKYPITNDERAIVAACASEAAHRALAAELSEVLAATQSDSGGGSNG
jgi:hypothetical protein